jgi:hypothetical protein
MRFCCLHLITSYYYQLSDQPFKEFTSCYYYWLIITKKQCRKHHHLQQPAATPPPPDDILATLSDWAWLMGEEATSNIMHDACTAAVVVVSFFS